MNYRSILKIIGFTTMVEGIAILLSAVVSLLYRDSDFWHIAIPGFLILLIGGIGFFSFRRLRQQDIHKKEGFLIVVITWLLFSLLGTIPFMTTGAIPTFTDAFFESMSGFTTTGASIVENLNDRTVWTHGILFWRSLTQWLGGLGIILLVIAILPLLGVGGMQLFNAEATGISRSYLSSKASVTARRLWVVYLVLSALQVLSLMLGGMNFFESVCHSFTTLATGGFSTRQESFIAFSPYIQYVTVFFMFVGGINFALSYTLLTGKAKQVFRNEELRIYMVVIVLFSLLSTYVIMNEKGWTVEHSFRAAIFQITSILTTTGFVSEDYGLFPTAALFLLFIAMFTGACAGSTTGGIKIVRVWIMIKNAYFQLIRHLRPNAVIPIKADGQSITADVLRTISAFIFIYFTTLVIGTFIFSLLGFDFDTSLGAVVSALSGIGPALGEFGPSHTYAFVPPEGKWLLSFLMLLGRLELFTVLVIFTPSFWKK